MTLLPLLRRVPPEENTINLFSLRLELKFYNHNKHVLAVNEVDRPQVRTQVKDDQGRERGRSNKF